MGHHEDQGYPSHSPSHASGHPVLGVACLLRLLLLVGFQLRSRKLSFSYLVSSLGIQSESDTEGPRWLEVLRKFSAAKLSLFLLGSHLSRLR